MKRIGLYDMILLEKFRWSGLVIARVRSTNAPLIPVTFLDILNYTHYEFFQTPETLYPAIFKSHHDHQ
jgi:hypothetical protein